MAIVPRQDGVAILPFTNPAFTEGLGFFPVVWYGLIASVPYVVHLPLALYRAGIYPGRG